MTFPFIAKSLLDTFLDSITNVEKMEDNVMDYSIPGELCYRECRPHDIRVCYFKFRVKFYQVLSG